MSNAPHRGVVAAQRAKAGRNDTLAAIMSGNLADAKPSTPATPKNGATNGTNGAPAPKPEVKSDAPSETETQTAPDAETETGSEAASETRTDVSAVAPDAETSKRVAAIQAAERRKAETIAGERAKLDQRAKAIETEWSPRVKKAEDFEALQAKAKKGGVHLVDALRALGLGDDDLEPAAQVLYAHSKAGAADPARKQQADKLLREREAVSEVESLRAELRELKGDLSKEREQQTFDQQRTTFLDHTVKAIADDMPIAKALATKNPTKLRAALWATTVELTEANDGEMPDFPDIVAAYEAQRRAELEELGLSPPTATKTPDKKPNTPPADKQNPARTLSNDLSTPRVPRPAQSGEVARKEHRKESLRMIESGKLD